jgi:hypothetical protein
VDALSDLRSRSLPRTYTVLAGLLPAVRNELPDLVSKLTRDVTRETSGRIRFTATAADVTWAATPTRQALVKKMVEERLLVEDEPEPSRKVLRVAHEAMLRQWGPAKNAVEAIADRALRMARFLRFVALAIAVVFLLVAATPGRDFGSFPAAFMRAGPILKKMPSKKTAIRHTVRASFFTRHPSSSS